MENKIQSGFFSNQNAPKQSAPISSQRQASFWDNDTTPSQLCNPAVKPTEAQSEAVSQNSNLFTKIQKGKLSQNSDRKSGSQRSSRSRSRSSGSYKAGSQQAEKDGGKQDAPENPEEESKEALQTTDKHSQASSDYKRKTLSYESGEEFGEDWKSYNYKS